MIKTFNIELESRYNPIITQAIRDKQHLWNNLVLIWNKTKSKEIKSELMNYRKFKGLFNGKISNLKYKRHYPDQWKVISDFKEKYTYDVFFDILKEFNVACSNAINSYKRTGKISRLKTKRLNKVKTGSISLAENNSTYYKGKKTKRNVFHKEFGLALYTQSYMKKELNKTANLKIYFNAKKALKGEVKFRTTRLVKKYTKIFLEIQYISKERIEYTESGIYHLSIDPGIKNSLTITSDNPKAPSLLVSNYALDSLFLTQTKFIDNLKSGWRKDNFFAKLHKVKNQELNKLANRIIDYCKKYSIGKIIMGEGYTSKTNGRISRKNNRGNHKFPHYTLLMKLKDRISKFGITLETQEESYTSKVSCLNQDAEIWNYKFKESVPPETILNQGSRSTRSIFKHTLPNGKIITFNADVNGSFNILMKNLKRRINIPHRALFHPIRIKNDFEFLNILSTSKSQLVEDPVI